MYSYTLLKIGCIFDETHKNIPFGSSALLISSIPCVGVAVVGSEVGICVGLIVGFDEGIMVGSCVGVSVGNAVDGEDDVC